MPTVSRAPMSPSRLGEWLGRRGAQARTAWWATASASVLAACVTGAATSAQADEPLWSEVVEAATQSAVRAAEPAPMCSRALAVPLDAIILVGPPLPDLLASRAPETMTVLVPAAMSNEQLAVAHPLLADRFELAEMDAVLGRWDANLTEARDPTRCALERALSSPSSAVVAHARVVRARCLLMVDDATAVENLESLLRRYPELPDEVALRLEEARSLARRGRHEAASTAFRAIDLVYPGTHEGRLAREGLAALATDGHQATALTPRERVERAARLVRSGPPDLARDELAILREAELPTMLSAEVFVLSARTARVEGRFDEADAFTARARELDPRLAVAPVANLARPESEVVTRELRTAGLGPLVDAEATDAQRTRALRRVPSARLLEVVRSSARAGMTEINTALVGEAARRPTLACAVRFEMLVVASGTASDDALVSLADHCVSDASYGVRARYLRARALERMGRGDEAATAYRGLVHDDRSDTGFYALWSRQRLAQFESLAPTGGETDAAQPAPQGDEPAVAATDVPADETADAIDIAATLAALTELHGESYPWLARARELVAIGDREAAREELHELYLAWLDARGRGPIRAGVEAVYRGATRQRVVVPATLRRLRRNLAGDDAIALARVAEALGDVGLAIRFGGTSASDRPRAFEALVTSAAARHELDPNLLLAVMRVESVYDPEIVSYAGAIGLLQIMPRTGRLIAHRLGLTDFRTDDLLDPATNIELAAWYLRSLIDRFEGRLPLAIAAYNGGPHNVRRWMEEHGENLPLDAFLERIPFDQTFRYVRRVLSHYVAYRAQEGLAPPELDTTLPPRATDTVAF